MNSTSVSFHGSVITQSLATNIMHSLFPSKFKKQVVHSGMILEDNGHELIVCGGYRTKDKEMRLALCTATSTEPMVRSTFKLQQCQS